MRFLFKLAVFFFAFASCLAQQPGRPIRTYQGGTGLQTYAAGDLVYWASGTTYTRLAIAAANRLLRSTGTAPAWTTTTLETTTGNVVTLDGTGTFGGVRTFSADVTHTADFFLQSTVPRVWLQDTDGTVNERIMDVNYNGNELFFTSRADSQAFVRNALTLGFNGNATLAGTLTVNGTGANRVLGNIEGVEIVAPAAPALNEGRLFFRDNGAGKTQLAVIFNTGAVQVIATEP